MSITSSDLDRTLCCSGRCGSVGGRAPGRPTQQAHADAVLEALDRGNVDGNAGRASAGDGDGMTLQESVVRVASRY
jgi:hypothetical protein